MNRILAVAFLALALVACGGDDASSSATATPVQSITPESTAGPAPTTTPSTQPSTLPVQRVPVRWVPEVSPFDIANAGNPDAPFADRVAELQRRDARNGLDEWQIGLVQGSAAPRIIYRTRKGLTLLSWSSGLQASLVTERPVPSSVLGTSKAFRWQGSISVDVASGQATEKLNPFPDGIGTTVEGSLKAVNLAPGRPDQSLVVSFTQTTMPGPPGSPMPGPPTTISTHLINAQGTSRRLEGLPDAPDLKPLANGLALVGGPDRAGRVYLVPTQDGDALVVTMVSGMAIEQVLPTSTQPSTSSGRVFLALNTGATGSYVIYDSATHSLREIGRGTWPGQGVQGAWFEPDKVSAGREYIDLKTGRREPVPPTPDGALAARSVVSPDKRYVLHLTPPNQLDPPGDCTGVPLKVELEENAQRRTIFECAGGNGSGATWLDNTHAIVSTTVCRGGCDDPKAGLLLVDATTGRTVRLTEGWVEGPYAQLSPDGTRMLVGGDSLEVRSLDGTLLRRIQAPPQRRITNAVWSPDGSSFAYLVAPRGWYFFGP
jgi:hypothetical protein